MSTPPNCPNGHVMTPGRQVCEVCGARIDGAGASSPEEATAGGLRMRTALLLAAAVAILAAIATAGAVILFGGSGGGSEPAPVAANPGDRVVMLTPTSTPSPTPSLTPSPTPQAGETRDRPVPVAMPVEAVGGWEVAVVGANFDVVDEVLETNPFNSPPNVGKTFVLVRLRATNRSVTGDEAGRAIEFRPGPTFMLVDAAGNEHFTFDDGGCGVIPDGFAFLDEPQPPGGTVEGNICFQVPEALTADLVLFDDESNTWFALR